MAKKASWHTKAKRLWPRAVWIDGEGQYAVVTPCRQVAVSLWPDLATAENVKE